MCSSSTPNLVGRLNTLLVGCRTALKCHPDRQRSDLSEAEQHPLTEVVLPKREPGFGPRTASPEAKSPTMSSEPPTTSRTSSAADAATLGIYLCRRQQKLPLSRAPKSEMSLVKPYRSSAHVAHGPVTILLAHVLVESRNNASRCACPPTDRLGRTSV
jgi:hypothetical protein